MRAQLKEQGVDSMVNAFNELKEISWGSPKKNIRYSIAILLFVALFMLVMFGVESLFLWLISIV